MSGPGSPRLRRWLLGALSWPVVLLMSFLILAVGIAVGNQSAPTTIPRSSEPELVTPPTGELLIVKGRALLVSTHLGDVLATYPIPELRLESVSPDLRSVATISPDGGTLGLIDLQDGGFRVLVTDPQSLYGYARWSTDGRYLYFIRTPRGGGVRTPWDVMRAEPASGSVAPVTPRQQATFDQVTPLPDGRIVYESQTREIPEPMTIYVSPGSGTAAGPLFGAAVRGRQCASLDVSPDGTKLAVSCGDNLTQHFGIVVYDLGSGSMDEIDAPLVQPRWVGNDELAALNLFRYGECPDTVTWIRADRATSEILHDPGAYLRIVGAEGAHLLMERQGCKNGEGVGPASILWVNSSGQTYKVMEAQQALWWRR